MSKEDAPSKPADAFKPHLTYFMEDLYIAIEGDLFKVPRVSFENNSDVFHDMFTVPVPNDKPADGSSQEHPLHLPGVTSDEFVQLLRVLFSDLRRYRHDASLDHSQYESVLRLSNLWQFSVVRAFAIDALQSYVDKISPQEALVMARKYNVEHWLVNAVEALATRASPISMDDVSIIGMEDALKVADVREQAMDILKASSRGFGWVDWKDRSALNFKPTIMRVFGLVDVAPAGAVPADSAPKAKNDG